VAKTLSINPFYPSRHRGFKTPGYGKAKPLKGLKRPCPVDEIYE
jgi:hypothetical protein